MRVLGGSPTKINQKLVEIEKVASICVVWQDLLEMPFKNGSKLKRLFRFPWSNRISYKNHSKTNESLRGCFDLHGHGLLGFRTKTIEKGAKIEKVASICGVCQDLLQKPFKKRSKLKRLLRFPCCSRISYENHSKTGQN